MKPAGTLVAERPLAQHSDRLGKRPPELGELAAALAKVAERLERALPDALEDLLAHKPAVSCGKVEKVATPRLHKTIAPVAANCLLADAGGAHVVATLSYAQALALTDQVFGGTGTAGASNPDRLPASADLTVQRFAVALGAALGEAFERAAPLAPSERSEVFGKFVSARDDSAYLLLRCEVAVEGHKPWEVLLTVRQDHAARLLDAACAPPPAREQGDRRRPDAEPFGKLPLPLTAVLAEMHLPVARVSALKPGDLLPLALNGRARLLIGKTQIARGQIGTSEGAMALQLTTLEWTQTGVEHDG